MSESEDGKQGPFAQLFEEFGRRQDELERRMSEPTPRNIAKARIFGARTREQIERARGVIREWVEEHPEDRLEFGKYASDLWTIEYELDEKERRTRTDEGAATEGRTNPEAYGLDGMRVMSYGNGASEQSEREREDLEALDEALRNVAKLKEEMRRPTPYNLAMAKIWRARGRSRRSKRP